MKSLSTPLLSVVIPTHKRPKFLSQAIESALQAAPDGDVQVIVVPNGQDESWKNVANTFSKENNIQWLPIAQANGNLARNIGLKAARGEYVRFLDDDDYLLKGAAEQIILLDNKGANFCSGKINSVDVNGDFLGEVSQPETDDFCCAAFKVSGFTLPVGNVYRRSCLQGLTWDPNIKRRQDNAWMIDLALAKEWNWKFLDQPVGAWVQHPEERVSAITRLNEKLEPIIARLLAAPDILKNNGRLNLERRSAIAQAIWDYAHLGFPQHPVYWSKIIRRALEIDPGSRPKDYLYTHGFLRNFHPIFSQWLLLLPRWLLRIVREISMIQKGHDYRRRL